MRLTSWRFCGADCSMMPAPFQSPFRFSRNPHPMQRPTQENIWSVCVASALGLAIIGEAQAAGSLTVTIKNTSGDPVEDAVVWIETADPNDTARTARAVMNQLNQQFSPFVLPVAVGTTVDFPNNDPFRHHVYFFSAAKSFELKLYGGGETQSVTFDMPGPVALGCDIHDNMLGYVFVAGSPFFATADNTGTALIEALPAGSHQIRVWHPNQRSETPVTSIEMHGDDNASAELTMSLKPDRRGRRSNAYDERGY